MTEANKKKPSVVFPLVLIGVVVVILGGYAAYVATHKEELAAQQQAQSEQPATVGTEPATTTAAPSDTMAANSAVVATRTLNLPPAPAPQIPVTTSTDAKVEEMMGTRKVGSDDAPIKIVEFASLTCGHCSAFHQNDYPRLKAEYIDTGKVQMIFKEFPLNKPAVDASMLLRCLPAERYESFMGLLFTEQPKWAYQADYLTPLKQYAKLAGLSDADADACLANKELEKRLVGDMKLGGDKYKIQSTPSFIVNDGAKTIVGHQPYGFIKQTLDEILGVAPVAGTPPANQPAPTLAPAVIPDMVAPAPIPPQGAPASTDAAAPVPELPAPAPEAKQ